MAQQTIKDAIAQAIITLLNPLVSAGALSLVQQPVSGGVLSSPQNLACYIFQTAGEPPENELQESEGENLEVTAVQGYELNLIAVQSDSATTPVDTVLNTMEAAVVSAILTSSGDNLAANVPAGVVLGAVWFDPVVTYFRNPQNQAIFGVKKVLNVEFLHVQNSLMVPAS